MRNNSIEPVNGSGLEGDPYIISEITHLAWISEQTIKFDSQGKYFKLNNDIDAKETAVWEEGKGFYPIGTKSADGFHEFKGFFDGNGKVISNLTIERPNEYFIGLFGIIGKGGLVKNLGIENANISGISFVGGLVGLSREQGVVKNCFSEAKVCGSNSFIGGLIGQNNGTMQRCYTDGTVTGEEYIGGLVGENKGHIENCYATSNVIGYKFVGGLAGSTSDTGSNILSCYSTGDIIGNEMVGGLIGSFYEISGRPTILNSFSSGRVKANDFAGSLIGSSVGTISNCYASGEVSCNGLMCKGLLGYGNESEGCYWSVDYAKFPNIPELVSLATLGWDFENIWSKGKVHPILKECGVDDSLFFEHIEKKRIQVMEYQKLIEQKRIQEMEEQKLVEQKRIQLEEEKNRLAEEKLMFIESLKAKRYESKLCINCGERLGFIEKLSQQTTHKKCTDFRS